MTPSLQYNRYRLGLRLGLAASVAASDLQGVISVTPEPPGGINVSVPEASYVLLEGSFAPGTDMAVCVSSIVARDDHYPGILGRGRGLWNHNRPLFV